jgi:hypothetical protein
MGLNDAANKQLQFQCRFLFATCNLGRKLGYKELETHVCNGACIHPSERSKRHGSKRDFLMRFLPFPQQSRRFTTPTMSYRISPRKKRNPEKAGFASQHFVSHISSTKRTTKKAERERKASQPGQRARFLENYNALQQRGVAPKDWAWTVSRNNGDIKQISRNAMVGDSPMDDYSYIDESGFNNSFDNDADPILDHFTLEPCVDGEVGTRGSNSDPDDSDSDSSDNSADSDNNGDSNDGGSAVKKWSPLSKFSQFVKRCTKFAAKVIDNISKDHVQLGPSKDYVKTHKKANNWDRFVECQTGKSGIEAIDRACICVKTSACLPAISLDGISDAFDILIPGCNKVEFFRCHQSCSNRAG